MQTRRSACRDVRKCVHARVLCVRVDMGPYEFGVNDYGCVRGILC